MQAWGLVLEVVALLAACLLAGGLCSALRQNPIVGYLLAGMLLGGPGSLGIVRSQANIEAIAELGVALLLFSLGLEFSWGKLIELGRKRLLAGAVQVVLTAVVGTLVVLLFGFKPVEAMAVGAMVSLSSTAAVLRVLIDQGEFESIPGRNSLGILLVQDMAVVPLAVLMTILAGGGDAAEVALNVGKILGLALVLVVGFYLVISQGAVRLLGLLSIEKNRELTVLLAVVVGLGSTWAAHAAGLSPALGAFLAGMFLGSSPFAVQVRADVSSLRVVLLTLFFGAVGMVADPMWIGTHLPLVLGATALLIVLKAILVWGILRVFGQPDGASLATGLCLAQIGEFAFVLGKTGLSGGVVGPETYMLVVSTAIVSLMATPYLVRFAPVAALVVQRWRDRKSPAGRSPAGKADAGGSHLRPDVLIIGYGPAGQAIGNSFVGKAAKVVVVDLNAAARGRAESLGFTAQIGDATSLDLLQHAGVSHAKIVAVTLPARSAALAVLDVVRQLNPDAFLIARCRYQIHQPEFERSGADVVIGDEAEVGTRLAECVRGRLDLLPPGDDQQ